MGWIKRQIESLVGKSLAGKARKKAGSLAPLAAAVLMLVGFIAQGFGNVALSDLAMQAYQWFGVDSPLTAEQLVALRDALNSVIGSLYVILAPIAGAGGAAKLASKRKDAEGKLSKPPVISDQNAADLNTVPGGDKVTRFNRLWRHHMNDEGLSSEAAFRRARKEVFGA